LEQKHVLRIGLGYLDTVPSYLPGITATG